MTRRRTLSAFRRRRRGVAALLAMLFLVLFSTLALGFYASTTTSAQVAANDKRSNDVLLATDSAIQFARQQMISLNLPYGTTNANLMSNVASRLGYLMNGTSNMGTNTVALVGGQIDVPSAIGWINLDPTTKTRFRITITQPSATSNILQLTVRGGSSLTGATRAVQMQYKPATGSFALMGLNSVSMSGGAFTDSYDSTKGAYAAASAHPMGNIASNGSIALTTGATIKGDARCGPTAAVTLATGATVTGRTAPLPQTMTFPSAALPATYTDLGNVTQSSGTTSLPGGVYRIGALSLSGTAHITWTGPVELYIATSYSVTQSAAIDTYQNIPANRTLYFLPTCTTATWSGTNVCIGELYAPDTAFTISGSVQLMGRVLAKSIVNSSTGGMHADETLPLPSGAGGYAPVPGSYLEVP